MKKAVTLFVLMVFAVASAPLSYAQTAAYNFGDFKSSTLTTKAWQALNANDLDGVLAYTNKCIEMYAANALQMQAKLSEYPTGTDQEIFSFWALNDVATCYYIQGEAYRQAKKKTMAKAAFEKVVKDFTYGQAWDGGQKLFWKPAEAAQDKLFMIESGLNLDFGDMSSSFLVGKSWGALNAGKLKAVEAYVEKVFSLYSDKAKSMQASLTEYPWESKEKIFSYWALNDVATAYFILGEAYRQAGMNVEATAAFQKLVNEFSYGQAWDPQGWFWKPAEAAEQKLVEMEAVSN